MPVVVLLGMLDVQGLECAWLRDRLTSLGTEVLLVDTGILDAPQVRPDVWRDEVARAAGADPSVLDADHDTALGAMARGAAEVTRGMLQNERLDAVLTIGGHGNSTIGAAAMRALPDRVPKLMISGVADVPPGGTALMYSVGGAEKISARALAGAAAAIAQMATGRPAARVDGPIIGLTLADETSECLRASRELLGILGYEVLAFSGAGRSYEAVASGGLLTAALDATLVDLSTGLLDGDPRPGRLDGAASAGVPQVVSLGGLDMARFGGAVPSRLDGRRRVPVHDQDVTLVRTTPAESAELGRRVAARLRDAVAPTALYVPLRGLSSLSVPGGPFHDPAADDALFDALRDGLANSDVEFHTMDTEINDPAFGRAMADHLHTTLTAFPLSAAAS
jgi:uncharacterized protein (UPF0261 family)